MSQLKRNDFAAIDIRGLKLRAFPRVDPFDFQLDYGEQLAVVGPRDEGQVDLIQVLSGGLAVDASSATILGTAVHSTSAAVLTNVGHFSADLGVFTVLTVREQLEFIELASNRCTEGAGEDCLGALGLDAVANITISDLSAIDLRKLQLAIAIISDPELLLLNNPTRDLSAPDRRHLIELLGDVVPLAAATVLATDDVELASRLTNTTRPMFRGHLGPRAKPEKRERLGLPAPASSSATLGSTAHCPSMKSTEHLPEAQRGTQVLRVQAATAEPRLEELLLSLQGVASVARVDDSSVAVTHSSFSGFGSDVVARLAEHDIRIVAVYPETSLFTQNLELAPPFTEPDR